MNEELMGLLVRFNDKILTLIGVYVGWQCFGETCNNSIIFCKNMRVTISIRTMVVSEHK